MHMSAAGCHDQLQVDKFAVSAPPQGKSAALCTAATVHNRITAHAADTVHAWHVYRYKD